MITKRSHSLVRHFREVRDGKNKDLLYCEGEKLLLDLLKTSLAIELISCTQKTMAAVRRLLQMHKKTDLPLLNLSGDVMNFVSDVKTPPGIVALAKRPSPPSPTNLLTQKNSIFLVLHRLQLPQNIGHLLRTAEATCTRAVFLTKNTADPYSPKAVRGSTGSAFRLPIVTGVHLNELLSLFKSYQVDTVAALQEGTRRYDEFNWSTSKALVIGAEGGGFTSQEKALFNATVRIPMGGQVESLNVGTAAAVCLYEAYRQKQFITR